MCAAAACRCFRHKSARRATIVICAARGYIRNKHKIKLSFLILACLLRHGSFVLLLRPPVSVRLRPYMKILWTVCMLYEQEHRLWRWRWRRRTPSAHRTIAFNFRCLGLRNAKIKKMRHCIHRDANTANRTNNDNLTRLTRIRKQVTYLCVRCVSPKRRGRAKSDGMKIGLHTKWKQRPRRPSCGDWVIPSRGFGGPKRSPVQTISGKRIVSKSKSSTRERRRKHLRWFVFIISIFPKKDGKKDGVVKWVADCDVSKPRNLCTPFDSLASAKVDAANGAGAVPGRDTFTSTTQLLYILFAFICFL